MSRLPIFGTLRHKIVIMENANQDALGAEVWREKYVTFAEIKPLYDNKVGSIENFDFGHVVTEGYYMFRIRAMPDVTNKMRIHFIHRVFEIKRVIDEQESGRILKIITLEI